MTKVSEQLTADLTLVTDTATTDAKSLITPVYNVDGYGATGDGTTDDYAAVAAAVAVAKTAGKGRVVFGPKNYLIKTQITLPSNVTVEGHGMGITTITAGAAMDAIFRNDDTTNGNARITIRDMTLHGGTTLVGYGNVYLTKCSNVLVENVESKLTNWCGIIADGGDHAQVVGCSVHDVKRHGILFTGGQDDSVALRNTAYNCAKDGIEIYSGSLRNLITYNNVTNCGTDDAGTGSWAGINVYDGCSYTDVSHNKVWNSPNMGVRIKNSQKCRVAHNDTYDVLSGVVLLITDQHADRPTETLVEGNNVYNTASHGMYTSQSSATGASIKGSKFIGNTIKTCGINTVAGIAGSATAIGMSLNFCPDVVVEGNTVEGCANTGIQAQSSGGVTTQGMLVANNVVKNNNQRTATGSASGITLAGINYNVMNGNVCYDDQGTKTQVYGIYTTGDRNTVVGNMLYGNKTGALYSTGSTNLNSANNVVA